MKAVIQRVSEASVKVDGITVGGLNVKPLVGAPISHGFIVEQLIHAEHRHRCAVQG